MHCIVCDHLHVHSRYCNLPKNLATLQSPNRKITRARIHIALKSLKQYNASFYRVNNRRTDIGKRLMQSFEFDS